jgi:glycosyltransferase involved in cell wall biosynthesis
MVSVIIPIRRGENIVKLLLSLANSSYKNLEVLVIDEGLERSAQRNIGIKKAQGEFLLILDSDQHVSPKLISECVRDSKSFVDAFFIPEKLMSKGLFSYIRDWERQFYTGTPIDCVRFVKAKDCPKFDERQSGPEDCDWDRRVLGYRTITKNCLYHYENVGIVNYFKKKAYYAKSMRRFAERNPGDKVLDWRWRCFGVFFERGKWKRFLSRPDLALAVMAIILARGVIYLCQR